MNEETTMKNPQTYYMQANAEERLAFRKWLSSMMRMGPVKVTFKKKDGTLREMNCTLEEGVVVPHEKTTDRVKQENIDVCAVWDIDKSAWRSFRYDSITQIDIEIVKEND